MILGVIGNDFLHPASAPNALRAICVGKARQDPNAQWTSAEWTSVNGRLRMDLCEWISPAGAIKEVARKGETKNPQHFNLLITSERHLVYSRVLVVNLRYGSCYHLCSISCGETCVLRFTNIHLAS
jgi:hypothetical protein